MESLAYDTSISTNQSDSYKLSLCVCTMNRPDDLKRCLESILAGNEFPEEIIVSDDSSDPTETEQVVQRYPSVIYQDGPKRGLGPNRNACIRRASGTHIIFIDDDVCVPPDFFTTARKLIAEDPTDVITGYEMKQRHWEGSTRKVIPHNADFWGTMCLAVANGDDCCAVVMNATIFPKTLFKKALFDECLRYGYEELDIARHAISLGYRILHKDTLWVNHYQSLIDRQSNWKLKHSSQMYTTAKAYFYYEKSLIKTLMYALLAPLKITGSLIKRKEPEALQKGIYATAVAYRHFFSKTEKGLSTASKGSAV